jgi:small GTP-binding protein
MPAPQRHSEKRRLPPGVKLLRTFEGHKGSVNCVAFDPGGKLLASGSDDHTIKLWKANSGKILYTLRGHEDEINSIAFDPMGRTLASGSADSLIRVWNVDSGELLYVIENKTALFNIAFDPTGRILASGSEDNSIKLRRARDGELRCALKGHTAQVYSVAFDPTGSILASGSQDRTVKLWEVSSGALLRTLEGAQGLIASVTFDPTGRILAIGGDGGGLSLWEAHTGKLLSTLEGQTNVVTAVEFHSSGRLLVSKSWGGSVLLRDCSSWGIVGTISGTSVSRLTSISFHGSRLAVAGSGIGVESDDVENRLLHIYELDLDVLLKEKCEVASLAQAVHHTTGKIVLVGDHSVGKSGLGYRMIHGYFKEQASTHGQQFWVFPELGKHRGDGTECEAILWDLAGQPDYRLVHALFVDDADLALVLFDASDIRDPLRGVGFWLQQLRTGGHRCPAILVGAQVDRGISTLTEDELKAFCRQQGVAGSVRTSAFTGEGVAELIEHMKALIPWDDKPATVTTTTFKRIKNYVLGLKEAEIDGQAIIRQGELRRQLEATDAEWRFTDDEMLTAVGHLENYGYVKRLRTSKGEQRILLAPDLLNNLASSFVLEARRNPKGLGSLEEKRLLTGYPFPEVANLFEEERAILLDSAALLFLEHNVCFREIDPLRMESYLVFPELINLKKPLEEDKPAEDGVAYTVSGATENVFASLVVLLGYTNAFTRTNQWQNYARYDVGDGLVCGFRQDAERDGELDFVLYFGPAVPLRVQMLFQSLFENFLARRNLTVMRYEVVVCSQGHQLNRAVVRDFLKRDEKKAFCSKCGEPLTLAREEAIQLTQEQQAELEKQRHAADKRTRFEQALFRVQAYVEEQKVTPPECFISYAWGVKEHERWVEKSLATDLQKAGIKVLLDRWENSRIGSSILRFVERIEACGQVIVVGTPMYRQKARNAVSGKGSVVAAEWDLAGIRMLGTETTKQTVLPVLLEGEEIESFPALLRGRVYADFRDQRRYFLTAFDLVLSLYDISQNDPAVADLRDSLIAGDFAR